MHVCFCFWTTLFFLLNIHYTLNPELNVSVFELTLLVHKKQPLPQSPGWVLYPALSLILASPEFKTEYIRHNDRLTSQKQEDIDEVMPNLFAGDFFADEEVELVSVFGWVVYPAGRRQSVTSSSSRLLIVTGQRLRQIPVNDKPENTALMCLQIY